MLFVGTLSYIDRSALSVGLPAIKEDLDISPALEGLLISSFFWTYAAMQIPAGWLIDKIGPRRILVVVMTVWALTQVMTGLAQTVLVLFIARLILGVVEAAGPVSGGQLAGVWLPGQDRARGATLSDSASALGGALGGFFIAGLIGLTGDWRLSFLVLGGVSIFAGLVVWVLLRDTPRDDEKISPEELAYIESELALEDQQARELNADSTEDGRNPLASFARHKTAWATWLGFFFGNIVFYGLLTYGPIYLSSERGVNIKSLAWALPIIFGAGFVGENVAGYIVQRWRQAGGDPNRVMKVMIGTSSLIAMFAIIGVAFVPSLGAAIALLAITLFFLRWLGLYWSLPGTLVERNRAGLFAGAMNMFSNIGGIIAPIVVGLIVQATGAYFWGLIFFAACALLYFVCSMNIDASGRLGKRRVIVPEKAAV
jgi:ACS family D-galactonate transporter-like MFS transporter